MGSSGRLDKTFIISGIATIGVFGKLKVWIIQTGEPLNIDGGSPRPMRAINLANALIAAGHEVVLWSSTFDHIRKNHRYKENTTIEFSDQFTIRLIHSPGYRKNIGLDRLVDHAVFAYQLHKVLLDADLDVPDVGFVGYPPIESSFVIGKWFNKHNVPYIIDVKDQWPHIFLEPFHKSFRPVVKFFLTPYYALSLRAIRGAHGICSMSDQFTDWVCDFVGRRRNERDIAVPLTAPRVPFSIDALTEARAWWRTQHVDLTNKNRVCFIGSLSNAFDFQIVREVALRCLEKQLNVQFVICGDGNSRAEVADLFLGLRNVVMPGWIDAPKIAALAASCVATIAPYINNDAFMRSIPNKILDSLSHGLPVITTLQGTVKNLIESNDIGIYAESCDVVVNYLVKLTKGESFMNEVADRANNLYFCKFSPVAAYNYLVRQLEEASKVQHV